MKRSAVAVVDEPACIGCTRCIDACPVDAIIGAQGHMHTVVEDWCIGCKLCVPPCPVDCIEMVAPRREWTGALKRAAGERGRQRHERLAASEARSHGSEERKAILAALLGRK
jgi:electron transport complex protein RnfB